MSRPRRWLDAAHHHPGEKMPKKNAELVKSELVIAGKLVITEKFSLSEPSYLKHAFVSTTLYREYLGAVISRSRGSTVGKIAKGKRKITDKKNSPKLKTFRQRFQIRSIVKRKC